MTALALTPSAFMPRANVAAALKLMCRVIPKRRESIAVLNNILMRADGDGVVIAGTDLDMELRTRIGDAIADAGFAVTVPAHLSYDFARSSDAGDLTICDKGDTARFDLAGAVSSLQTLPVHDYPDLDFKGEVRAAFTMAADDLALALERCEHAISLEETRYYLNGVFLHVAKVDGRAVLRMVATDGHRLVRHDICDAPEGSADMPDIIIPRRTVSVLRHMLKPTYEGSGKSKIRTSPETVTLTVNCVRMRFECGAHTLVTKLIDGTFPDYERVIPSRNDKRLTVNAEALTRLINGVSIVSSELGRAVKLEIFDSSVVASVCNPDSGDAKARLDGVDYDGAPLEIGMNGRYLTSALGLFTGPVTIRFNEAGSPVTLTDHGQTLTVLMPIRV